MALKYKVGDKVQINDKSRWKEQGFNRKWKVVGTITGKDVLCFDYEVEWENGNSYLYDENDLIPYSEENRNEYEIY